MIVVLIISSMLSDVEYLENYRRSLIMYYDYDNSDDDSEDIDDNIGIVGVEHFNSVHLRQRKSYL